MNIARALGELGDVRAVGPLITVLNPDDRNKADRSSPDGVINDRASARARAAMALGYLDTPESRKALTAGVQNPDLAPYCRAALYRLTLDDEYVAALKQSMKGDSVLVAHHLAEYLKGMNTDEANKLAYEYSERVQA